MENKTIGLLSGLIIICLFTIASTYTEPMPVDKAAQNERAVNTCVREGNAPKACRDMLRASVMIGGEE